MLLNRVEVELEPLEYGLDHVLIAIVNNECDWHHLEDILVAVVTRLLQAQVKLVLLRQLPVELKMIHQVFLAMLPQEIKSYRTAKWTPLEIKQTALYAFNLGPVGSVFNHTLHEGAIVSFE
jgi:hypothetical protein